MRIGMRLVGRVSPSAFRRAIDMIFDVADLQDSRRCRGYRMLLTLLGYRVLLMLLVVNLRGGREPNEALVGVGS